jgi:hypothetical protein
MEYVRGKVLRRPFVLSAIAVWVGLAVAGCDSGSGPPPVQQGQTEALPQIEVKGKSGTTVKRLPNSRRELYQAKEQAPKG